MTPILSLLFLAITAAAQIAQTSVLEGLLIRAIKYNGGIFLGSVRNITDGTNILDIDCTTTRHRYATSSVIPGMFNNSNGCPWESVAYTTAPGTVAVNAIQSDFGTWAGTITHEGSTTATVSISATNGFGFSSTLDVVTVSQRPTDPDWAQSLAYAKITVTAGAEKLAPPVETGATGAAIRPGAAKLPVLAAAGAVAAVLVA